MPSQKGNRGANNALDIQYENIRLDFIQTEQYIDLKALARKHGCTSTVLYNRCNREDWRGQRKKFWDEVTEGALVALKDGLTAARVKRAVLVGKAIEKQLKRLEDDEDVTINDVVTMMGVEARLLGLEQKQENTTRNVIEEILVAHVTRIREERIHGTEDFDSVVRSGERRLGILPQGTSAGDGAGPERSGVRVRHHEAP